MRVKTALSILVPTVLILQAGTAWATHCGDAYFSREINWPQHSTLYYTVAGAPPNTCGDVWVDRNGGGYQVTQDWICSDANGNATKGPWYHSNQTDDETAYAYVDWGSCTTPVRKHIWDVNPPHQPTINSSVPSDFYGTASDNDWGAGFNDDWAICEGEYYNRTTGKWWSHVTGAYDVSSFFYPPCSFSGMPSLNVNWSTSTSQRPALDDHVSGNQYRWRIWVWDGGQWNQRTVEFTY